MEKTNNGLWYCLFVLALLLGVGLGAMYFASETEKQVLVPYKETVEVPVETIKEVPIDYVTLGVDLFLEKLQTQDFDKYLICDKQRYEADQFSVSRVYENSKISITEIDTDDKLNAEKEVVNFEVRLKFADELTQEKCYKNFKVEAVSVEGEESVIKVK